MSNGQYQVDIAVLQEWRNHVDEDLAEIKGMVHEIRADLNTVSRNVGRPLLTWGQVMTLAGSLVGTVMAMGAVLA